LSFTLMAVAVREVTPAIGTFQVMTFRTGIGFLILLPIVAWYRFEPIRTKRLPLHLARNFVHFFGQLGWFFGVTLLPLATVFALEFTTPLWAALLAVLVLGERLTRSRLIAVVFGFTGILIIVQPGLREVGIGTFVLLGAAMCFASTLVMTKLLTRTDSALTVLWYMTLIQAPFSLVLVSGSWVMPTTIEFAWLCLVGVTGLSAHYCTARALAVADATVVVPIDFLRLPLIAIVAAMLYDEPIRLAVLLGAVIIFSGNYYNIWCEQRGAAFRKP
ncbi:MAG: DMT family transporter, partial [Alphaproteobacteria bacterium]